MVFKLLPFDKWARFLKIIAFNGGPIKAALKLWRHDTLKEGTLMGTDSFGNKYYENSYYMIGRSRWVEYNPMVKWHYDASQITAEWYGWIHYKTDLIPSEDCAKYGLNSCSWVRCWLQPHAENLSGTDRAYYPYSTTKGHIYVWDGTTASSRGACSQSCEESV